MRVLISPLYIIRVLRSFSKELPFKLTISTKLRVLLRLVTRLVSRRALILPFSKIGKGVAG